MTKPSGTPPKIYILPVDPSAQPDRQGLTYPPHNKDWGVEQDFLSWLQKNPGLLCANPQDADYHYLPVFWTRFNINHDFARRGREELQSIVDDALLDDTKTFTICQYDDGPLTNLGSTIQFLASRQGDVGIDIPLLCSEHKVPFIRPRKKYLGSFAGLLRTHPMREDMARGIRRRPDMYLLNGNEGSAHFVNVTLASRACLAPRGYGGSSFRLFEAMSLGIAPLVIGDHDTRPFKRFVDWDSCSLFTHNPREAYKMLKSRSNFDLWRMGRRARRIFRKQLTFGRWCPYVLRELEEV